MSWIIIAFKHIVTLGNLIGALVASFLDPYEFQCVDANEEDRWMEKRELRFSSHIKYEALK